jgi:hypothetical protein
VVIPAGGFFNVVLLLLVPLLLLVVYVWFRLLTKLALMLKVFLIYADAVYKKPAA